MISSRHVRALHPMLHVARIGRALNLRPCYNIAPTTVDRRREIGGDKVTVRQ
jgi:hypothetical protein